LFNTFIKKGPEKSKKYYLCGGEMAEWSIAAVLKTVVRVTGPGVRIPLSPQMKNCPHQSGDFCFQMSEPGLPERGQMKIKSK
jgi:hypothetical protein